MQKIIGSQSKEVYGDDVVLRVDSEGSISTTPPTAGLPYQFFLTTAGDGTGTINLASNYVSPTDVYYLATTRTDIYTMIISISDNANFNQGDFGAIGGGLTNGIKFFAGLGPQYGNAEVPLLSTQIRPIKKNYEWLDITPHTALTSFAGLAQTLVIDLNVVSEYGKVFPLDPGQKIIARLNDNLSTLVDFTIGIRGIRYT